MLDNLETGYCRQLAGSSLFPNYPTQVKLTSLKSSTTGIVKKLKSTLPQLVKKNLDSIGNIDKSLHLVTRTIDKEIAILLKKKIIGTT